MLFWLLAPFERVAGSNGLLVGTACINAACLVGAVAVANRRGGVALSAWVALFVAVLCHTLGSSFLIDPWNPWLPVTGLVLFVLVAWSVGCGDRVLWPLLIALASWEVQAHLGFAPVVAALIVAVASLRWMARWSPRPAARAIAQPRGGATVPGHSGRWAVAVGLALWSGPIVQQLTGRPGNLDALARYSLRPPAATVGGTYGIHVAANQLSLVPPWVTGREANLFGLLSEAPLTVAVVELAVLAAVGWLAWRHRHRDAAMLAALTLAAVAGGVFGLIRIVGIPFPYLTRWMWVVAMFVPLSAGWCVARVVRPGPKVRAGILGAVVAAAVVVVAVTTIEGIRPALPGQPVCDALAAVVPRVERALDPHRRYLIDPSPTDVIDPALGPGLQAELERLGYHAALTRPFALAAGAWRTATPAGSDATLVVVSRTDPTATSPVAVGWTEVAEWDPLSPAQRARATSLAEAIRARLGPRLSPSTSVLADFPPAALFYVAGGVPAGAVGQLAGLERLGLRYQVYLLPDGPR